MGHAVFSLLETGHTEGEIGRTPGLDDVVHLGDL